MPKSSLTLFFIIFTFLITLGLAISLQGVLGLNIVGTLTGPLNLGGNKIINVGPPTLVGDAATKGFVDSTFVPGGWYGICAQFTNDLTGSTNCAVGSIETLAPASCPSAPTGFVCACPGGYSLEDIALERCGGGSCTRFYSCYKY